MDIKTRPILFSGEMIRKILSREKTMTRRVIKQEFTHTTAQCGMSVPYFKGLGANDEFLKDKCPYGKIGDRLFVRETFSKVLGYGGDPDAIVYRAGNQVRHLDIENRLIPEDEPYFDNCLADEWKPSIFMPRWASRITLEITDVRVERLQVISAEDAIAEGISLNEGDCGYGGYWCDCCELHTTIFQKLWNKINGKKYPFESNPFVWCVSFRKLEAN